MRLPARVSGRVLGIACALACAPHALAQRWPEKNQVQTDFDRRFAAAPDVVAKTAVVNEMVALANTRLAGSLPGYSDLWSDAARRFRSLGLQQSAIQITEALAASGETPTWKANACYWLGQTADASQGAVALSHYQQGVQAVAGSLSKYNVEMYACLVRAAAGCQVRLGQRATAIRTREVLSTQAVLDLKLSAENGAAALIENGRDSFALGQVAPGRACFDTAWSRYPDFGQPDGSFVGFKMEAIRAGRTSQAAATDATYVESLFALWNDKKASGVPEVMDCGAAIVWAYSDRQETDKAFKHASAVRTQFLKTEAAWKEQFGSSRVSSAQQSYIDVSMFYMGELVKRKQWADVVSVGQELQGRPLSEGVLAAVNARILYAASQP